MSVLVTPLTFSVTNVKASIHNGTAWNTRLIGDPTIWLGYGVILKRRGYGEDSDESIASCGHYVAEVFSSRSSPVAVFEIGTW
jgi:hypothetical protein